MEKVADDVHAGFDLGHGPAAAGGAVRPRGGPPAVPVPRRAPPGGRRRLLAHPARRPGDRRTSRRCAASRSTSAPKTTSFRDWAPRLARARGGRRLRPASWTHWAAARAGAPLPVDRAGAGRRHAGAPVARSRAARRRGHRRAAARRRRPRTAPGSTTCCWPRWPGRCPGGPGSDRVAVELEGHGREDVLDGVDLSRTVGWFTTMFPVALEVPERRSGEPRLAGAGQVGPPAAARACPATGSATARCASSARTTPRAAAAGRRRPAGGVQLPRPVRLPLAGGRRRTACTAPCTTVDRAGARPGRPGRAPARGRRRGARAAGCGFSWYYRPDVHDEATVAAVAGGLRRGPAAHRRTRGRR